LLQPAGKSVAEHESCVMTPSPDAAGEPLDDVPAVLTRRQRLERTERALRTAAETGSRGRRQALLDYVVRLNLCVARDVARLYPEHGPDGVATLQVAHEALARAAAGYQSDVHGDVMAYLVDAIRHDIDEHGARAWAVPDATGWTPGT
jgi:hypothetical protein